MELTGSGKALVVILLFRLFFGGYLIGMDQYRFNDFESTLTVLLIYGLVGIFTALFLLGKRIALMGMVGLDAVFIVLQSVFIVAALSQMADFGPHDPVSNWWGTILMYVFSVLTITFALKAYREIKTAKTQFQVKALKN
ncbi:MAG: hypothetical protein NWF01_05260 [Candidatus Bathyarchaeota archaeon]|nr:hypothetical protein [Candidatus Bathyarchaeota archaeon]